MKKRKITITLEDLDNGNIRLGLNFDPAPGKEEMEDDASPATMLSLALIEAAKADIDKHGKIESVKVIAG